MPMISLGSDSSVNATSIDEGALAEALDRLATTDARLALLVQKHYFEGLTCQEVADELEMSEAAVNRDLRLSTAWLLHQLRPDPDAKKNAPPATITSPNHMQSARSQVTLPPAHKLVLICKFLLSKQSYERFIEPHVLDIRHEYYEALKSGHTTQARWIVVRGYIQALHPFIFGIARTIFRWLASSGA